MHQSFHFVWYSFIQIPPSKAWMWYDALIYCEKMFVIPITSTNDCNKNETIQNILLPFLWQVIGITSHREGSRYPIGWMFGKVPKVGAQRFTRGVDEEIDIFWVSGQNFSFNLSKHITLNFILYQCQYRTITLNI